MKASELISQLAALVAKTDEDLEVLMYDSYHLTMATPTEIGIRELQYWHSQTGSHRAFVLAARSTNANIRI